MKRSIVVALLLLPFAAALARAQIPGLGEAGRMLDRVPSLSSFLEDDPPITTSLDDAEAMRLYNECLTRSGRPEVPALNPTP